MDMAVHHALAGDVADVCADDRAGQEYRWSSIIFHLSRGSKTKDPHQLRVNSYRVLLTRGRDGFAIFVFNESGMHSAFEELKGMG